MSHLPPNVAVVNPLHQKEWNEIVLRCANSTVFHSANWARLMADSYGYHPTYLTLSDQRSFRACLPLMEVDSPLTGRRAVSLTFSDYCVALVESQEDFDLLFQSVLQLGRISRWRYVEFRGETFLTSEPASKAYAHHEIALIDNEAEMLSRLRESTARNIKKALREDVEVSISESLQGVKDFYRLHCLTRKRQGVPPQPEKFFCNLYSHLISKRLGFTALARQGSMVVAGVVCLHFGGNAVYKYGASDLRYQHLRANNLVLWEAIKECARRGCRSMSLGRTDLDNEGLITFKNGWGGVVTSLPYYKYDFAKNKFISDDPGHLGIYKTLFKKLPLPLLKTLGNLAYRHLG